MAKRLGRQLWVTGTRLDFSWSSKCTHHTITLFCGGGCWNISINGPQRLWTNDYRSQLCVRWVCVCVYLMGRGMTAMLVKRVGGNNACVCMCVCNSSSAGNQTRRYPEDVIAWYGISGDSFILSIEIYKLKTFWLESSTLVCSHRHGHIQGKCVRGSS